MATVYFSATSQLEQQHTDHTVYNDRVLYSKLNVSSMSLNIILRDFIAKLKATTDSLPQILMSVQRCPLKL